MFSRNFLLGLESPSHFMQTLRNISSLCKGIGGMQSKKVDGYEGIGSRNIQMNYWSRSKCRSYFNTSEKRIHTSNRYLTNSGDENNLKKEAQDITNVESSNIDVSNLLETWFYEVSPYGSLKAQLPFNTVITPLNPQNYPDMNKCIIELYYNAIDEGSGMILPNSHQMAQIADLYSMNVTFDKDKANMNIICDAIQGLNLPISCHIQVPLKFDLLVKMEGSEGIAVESMEGNSINIETDAGNVKLKKNKSGSVSVLSKSGNIVSKSTQLGNISMVCGGPGKITADKLQGSNVTCSTELGSVNVKSLYTESATFKTLTGNVHLGHCHGQVCVVGDKSNVHIESLDGDLDVAIQQGEVKVYLSRHNKVDVDLKTGDIGISFPEGTETNLNLSGASISVADNLPVQFDDSDVPYLKEGYIGREGAAQVNARTMSGNIDLSVLDWIQTTKLAFKNMDD